METWRRSYRFTNHAVDSQDSISCSALYTTGADCRKEQKKGLSPSDIFQITLSFCWDRLYLKVSPSVTLFTWPDIDFFSLKYCAGISSTVWNWLFEFKNTAALATPIRNVATSLRAGVMRRLGYSFGAKCERNFPLFDWNFRKGWGGLFSACPRNVMLRVARTSVTNLLKECLLMCFYRNSAMALLHPLILGKIWRSFEITSSQEAVQKWPSSQWRLISLYEWSLQVLVWRSSLEEEQSEMRSRKYEVQNTRWKFGFCCWTS